MDEVEPSPVTPPGGVAVGEVSGGGDRRRSGGVETVENGSRPKRKWIVFNTDDHHIIP